MSEGLKISFLYSDILKPGQYIKCKNGNLRPAESNLIKSLEFLTKNEIELRMENYESFRHKQDCLFLHNGVDITNAGKNSPVSGVGGWLCPILQRKNLRRKYLVNTKYNENTGEVIMNLEEITISKKQPQSDDVNFGRKSVNDEYLRIRQETKTTNSIYVDQQTTGSGKTYALVNNTNHFSELDRANNKSTLSIFIQPRKDMLLDFSSKNIYANKESEKPSDYYRLIQSRVIPIRVKDRNWYSVESVGILETDIEIVKSITHKLREESESPKALPITKELFSEYLKQLNIKHRAIKDYKASLKQCSREEQGCKARLLADLERRNIYSPVLNLGNGILRKKPKTLHYYLIKELDNVQMQTKDSTLFHYILATVGSFDGGAFKNIIEAVSSKKNTYHYFVTMSHAKAMQPTPLVYYAKDKKDGSEYKTPYGVQQYFNIYEGVDKKKNTKVKNTNLEFVIDEADQLQDEFDWQSFKARKHDSNYSDALSILKKGLYQDYTVGSAEFKYYQKNIGKLIKLSKSLVALEDKDTKEFNKIKRIVRSETYDVDEKVVLILERLNGVTFSFQNKLEAEVIFGSISNLDPQTIIWKEAFKSLSAKSKKVGEFNGKGDLLLNLLLFLSGADIRIDPVTVEAVVKENQSINYSSEQEQFLSNIDEIRKVKVVHGHMNANVIELKTAASSNRTVEGLFDLEDYFYLFISISSVAAEGHFNKLNSDYKKKDNDHMSNAQVVVEWFPKETKFLDKDSVTDFFENGLTDKKTLLTPQYIFEELKHLASIKKDDIDHKKTKSPIYGNVYKPQLGKQDILFESYLHRIMISNTFESKNITLLSATFDTLLTPILRFNRPYVDYVRRGHYDLLYLMEDTGYLKEYKVLKAAMNKNVLVDFIKESDFQIDGFLKDKMRENIAHMRGSDSILDGSADYKAKELEYFWNQIHHSVKNNESYIVFTLTKNWLNQYLRQYSNPDTPRKKGDFEYIKKPEKYNLETFTNCGVYDLCAVKDGIETIKARVIVYSTKLFDSPDITELKPEILDATDYPVILFTDNASSTGLNNHIWKDGVELDFDGIAFLESFFYPISSTFSMDKEQRKAFLLKSLFNEMFENGTIINPETSSEFLLKDVDQILNSVEFQEEFKEFIDLEEDILFILLTLQKLGRVSRRPGVTSDLRVRIGIDFALKHYECIKNVENLIDTKPSGQKELINGTFDNFSLVYVQMEKAVKDYVAKSSLSKLVVGRLADSSEKMNSFIQERLVAHDRMHSGHLDKKRGEAEIEVWEKIREYEPLFDAIKMNNVESWIAPINKIISENSLGSMLTLDMVFDCDLDTTKLIGITYIGDLAYYSNLDTSSKTFNLRDEVLLSPNYEYHLDLKVGQSSVSLELDRLAKIGLFNSVFMNNILKGAIGERFLEELFLEENYQLTKEPIPSSLYEKTDFIFKHESRKIIYSVDVKHWKIGKSIQSASGLKKELNKKSKKKAIDNFYKDQGYEVIHVLAPTISQNDTKFYEGVDLYVIPLNKYTIVEDEYTTAEKTNKTRKIKKNNEYSFFEELIKI